MHNYTMNIYTMNNTITHTIHYRDIFIQAIQEIGKRHRSGLGTIQLGE